MPAASVRERSTSEALLSIGQVLARLTPEFPDLSSSKLRYLEQQGIVRPARTESGYRKFSQDDIERLRVGLALQRDHYLPLQVIRQQLDTAEAEGTTAAALAPPPSITPAPRRYRREELLSAAAAPAQILNDAISTGVITAADSYGESTLTLLRGLVALDRHGIEPRHLRAVRQSAERDAALIESVLAPLLRRQDGVSRGKAGELAPELAHKLDEVRKLFVKQALARVIS